MNRKLFLSSLLFAAVALFSCGDDKKDEPKPVTPEPTPESPVTPSLDKPAAFTEIIYEANPRFFAKENAFKAIENRLGEIKDMGVTVLWLMPVNTPGVLKSVNSPYCVKDYKGLNAKYGNLSDFRSLVNAAHGKGMRVILDWVPNHTSWDNEWITAHPEWYTKDANGNIVYPSTWTDVADLNYNSKEMRAAMIDALKYWITETGIDGYRMDHVDGVPHDFWKEAIPQLRAVKSDVLLLAEGSDFAYYSDGFDMIYDWNFTTQLQRFVKGNSTFAQLLSYNDEQMARVPKGKRIMRYAINHDVIAENSPVKLFGSNDAMPVAQFICMMLDGTPLLYSGMEAGFTSNASFFDYRPLTWSDKLTEQYQKMGKVYQETANARGGELVTYEAGMGVCISRTNGTYTMLAMANPTNAEISIKVPMTYNRTEMTELFSGEKTRLASGVTLKPYEYKVFAK